MAKKSGSKQGSDVVVSEEVEQKVSQDPIDLGEMTMQPNVIPQPFNLGNSWSKPLRYYRTSPKVTVPEYKTSGSGCFDLHVHIGPEHFNLRSWSNVTNAEMPLSVKEDRLSRYIVINPHDRVLLPTGLIFEIPEGYAMLILPRSSTGVVKGLSIPNSIGFIDNDYRDEVYISVINNTNSRVRVNDNDRLAQGYMIPYMQFELEAVNERPKKLDRKGGFGSTGK